MGDTTPTPAPPAPAAASTAEPEYPSYGASMVPNIRLLLPQLVVAGVFPVIAYHFLRPHVSSDAVALAAVMVFPVAETVFRTVLAVSIPTQAFLVVSQVISWVVIGGLLWFSVAYSRQGEERVRALVEASPEAFPPRAPDPS